MAVKVDTREKGTVFQGQDKQPPGGAGRMLCLLLVLAGLLVVHFLNVCLQWSIIRGELLQKPAFHNPEYAFLGFAALHKQEIEAARRQPNARPPGRIFAYFDLLHPAVFMAWNNGRTEDFFDLGPILVALPVGASRIGFLPGSILVMSRNEGVTARNFGGSLAGNVLAQFLNRTNKGAAKVRKSLPGSYVGKSASGSPSQRIPYLVYFYLPLVLIAILLSFFGAGMATAFFYYTGMFFFFDFEKLFVTVPFAWLFRALNIELPDPWGLVLAAVVAFFFLLAGIYGLVRWDKREMPPSGKWLALFFVLLPLALFF